MAAGTIGKPGSEYGPCANGCQHKECAELRAWAATKCFLCGGEIGYDRHYYREPERGLVHAVCLEEKVEFDRKMAALNIP